VRDWRAFSPTVADLDDGRYSNVHIAPLPWQLQGDLIAGLRERGTRLISLDPDERNIQAADRSTLRSILSRVDLFLPSRQEAEAMFRGAGPLEALRRLRDLAPELPLVAVKCGAQGALAHSAGSREYTKVPAVPADVVDQTGAGDAFCGGALVGFARTGNIVAALLHGAVSASFAVAGLGAAGLLEASTEAAEERKFKLGRQVEQNPF
jgi:sugar/nucleoside kinase (ribokinase family)